MDRYFFCSYLFGRREFPLATTLYSDFIEQHRQGFCGFSLTAFLGFSEIKKIFRESSRRASKNFNWITISFTMMSLIAETARRSCTSFERFCRSLDRILISFRFSIRCDGREGFSLTSDDIELTLLDWWFNLYSKVSSCLLEMLKEFCCQRIKILLLLIGSCSHEASSLSWRLNNCWRAQEYFAYGLKKTKPNRKLWYFSQMEIWAYWTRLSFRAWMILN